MQFILDLFGHRWHVISDVSCIGEEEAKEMVELRSSVGFSANEEDEED